MLNEPRALAEIVGNNILTRRKKRKLTQEALAEVVGIGQQSLSRMEKGKIAPRFERLQNFADALGCTVADLFTYECLGDEDYLGDLQASMRPLASSSKQAVVRIAAEISRELAKLEKKQK